MISPSKKLNKVHAYQISHIRRVRRVIQGRWACWKQKLSVTSLNKVWKFEGVVSGGAINQSTITQYMSTSSLYKRKRLYTDF